MPPRMHQACWPRPHSTCGCWLAAKGTDKAADAGKVVKGVDEAADAGKAGKLAEDTKPPSPDAPPKPSGEKGDGFKVAKGKSREIGKCGEWLAKMDMIDEGFDQVVSVQNNSGHGTDLIGKNSKTGEVKVWEVKTTTTDRAPPLSKEQAAKGGERYARSRLGRAARGDGNFGKMPNVMADADTAMEWIKGAQKRGGAIYEKREVFVGDIDEGCAKHAHRRSKSKPWPAK